MANTIRIKRRSSGGAVGAPASLQNAELAFNEADNTLYYGNGTGGAGGTATTVDAIGGRGAVTMLTGNQTIAGIKTFSSSPEVPTVATSDNSVKAASTAFVKAQNYITGNQSITFTGDATGSGSTTVALTLANSGVTAGTYTKLTVDAKGRVTSGTQMVAADISDFDTRVRTSRLDQMAVPTAAVSMNSQRITNLAAPTADADAATKLYVDSKAAGLDIKESVRVATTANITLSGTQTIDGVVLIAGDRVLVKNQTTAADNGIYVVAAGAWARSSDAEISAEVTPGMFTFVEEGTVNADSGWTLSTNAPITLGTTSLTFTQFSGAGSFTASNGVTKVGNDFQLTGQALAFHNLATNGFSARTAAGTVAARSFAVSGSGISVTNADGVAGNVTYSLSAALSSIGGLTPAADRLAYYTGATTAALATITSFGRSIIDDIDATTTRATLGLGTISTQDASNVNITGGSIVGLTTFDNIVIDGGTF
jgi:phage-related tail fiber protein